MTDAVAAALAYEDELTAAVALTALAREFADAQRHVATARTRTSVQLRDRSWLPRRYIAHVLGMSGQSWHSSRER